MTYAHSGQSSKNTLSVNLEHLRKLDISELTSISSSDLAQDWLRRLSKSRAGHDSIYDYAYKVIENDIVIAIIWIIPEAFDADQYELRLVSLTDSQPDIGFWLRLINAVHKYLPKSISLTWLIDSSQTAGQEALGRWNYHFIGRISALLTDSAAVFHHDAWLYRTDCLRRPDQGTAFVPFKFGWLAVNGNKTGITSLDFVRTGQFIQEKTLRFQAQYLGLIDGTGKVLPADDTNSGSSLLASGINFLPEAVENASRQVNEYLAGERTSFNLPLEFCNYSSFQMKVWQEIRKVPYGATATYEDLAVQLKDPGQKPYSLARAVGAACAANPLPLVIPCHRIIGKNGRLTGFNGGVDIKEYLLNHEMFGIA